EQVGYIVNHAEDQYLFVDLLVFPLVEKLHSHFTTLKGVIVLCEEENLPKTDLPNVQSYESLIADESDEFEWPEFDENTASCLCYTSGTTGNPKGVMYSHRSTILHAYAGCMPDVMGLAGKDVVLPVVPMFHVNGWGIPYSTLMVGSKIVFPGPKMADGETLQSLMVDEGVTIASGVPTIWLALLDYLETSGKRIDCVKKVSVGGAACPKMIVDAFADKYNIMVHQGWGMTETSPLGTVFNIKPTLEPIENADVRNLQVKQGRGVFGIEMKITDPDDQELPWDGKAFGALKVRGAWVCNGYFRHDSDAVDEKGWFDTGDVAIIDPHGYMQITDRTKDVIKSGGEWISSIDLENAAVGHPDVAEAAVIGRFHPKWTERPLLIAVIQPGSDVGRDDVLSFLDGRVAKWWLPDDVVFVEELPHTATGKLNKVALREQFSDYEFPSA
ncbi:MAG: AMP-binding protein, partial [Pseudomonadota bacterium]